MLMRYLQNRGIAVRLCLGFGVVLLLLLAVAGFSLDRLGRYQQEAGAVVSGHVVTLDAVALAQESGAQRAVLLRDLVLNDSLSAQRTALARLRTQEQADAAALRGLQALAGAQPPLVEILEQVRRVAAQEKSLLALVADARFDDGKTFLADNFTPPQRELQGMLRRHFVATMADANQSVLRNEQNYRQLFLLIAMLAGAAVIIGAGVAFFTTRSIVRPLAGAREAALQVAQGDLSQEIDCKGADEIAQLVGALEWMRMSLADVVADIRTSAQEVTTGALQIERGNATLAVRTEEQASNLEETASAIEELTATVKQNADGAGQASALARETTGVAARGGAAVRGVVATMQGIQQSSSRIADIVGVIDGIAFQTNILALNAAVEAARAGEQGRGFAVVAAEVRSLAQRSAQAAKEIKSLIQESTKRVEGGVRQVEDAGGTMDEIVASVHRVDALIAEIAAASSEQLTGIEQVNRAITEMDHTTQQNAALVEEAAASAEHMARQAEVLQGTMAKFRLLDEQPGSGEQRDVAARRGGVDGQRLLGAEAVQVVRPAGLGSGA